MPPAPPQHRAQTLKQAKAAYKARGQPSLTEKEQRQIERACELERRAWRSREAEKKKADAAKKRSEKERREKAEQERVRMGSQRRCDRFGYKSSQMHLGTFMKKKGVQNDGMKGNLPAMAEESGDDSFGDETLDDETLLDALDGTNEKELQVAQPQPPQTSTKIAPANVNPLNVATARSRSTQAPLQTMDDFNSFWDDLDSSTQIARDLASPQSNAKSTSQASSASTDEFDLTAEDLEHLDPTPRPQAKVEVDRKLMPPPPLPTRTAHPEVELTMSQLESFMDDDLQLTQADPG